MESEESEESEERSEEESEEVVSTAARADSANLTRVQPILGTRRMNSFLNVETMERAVIKDKVLKLQESHAMQHAKSLEAIRERERRADQAQQLWLLFFFISFALLFSESERDIMKSSSSSSSSSIEATDCFSPLSEHQKQRTPSELRFRFRSTALKQSPSSDA